MVVGCTVMAVVNRCLYGMHRIANGFYNPKSEFRFPITRVITYINNDVLNVVNIIYGINQCDKMLAIQVAVGINFFPHCVFLFNKFLF